MHRGFDCECGYLTRSWKWLKVHHNREHRVKGSKGRKSRTTQQLSVRLQTFFTGPKSGIHYFSVTAVGAGGEGSSEGEKEERRYTPGGTNGNVGGHQQH